VKRKRLLLIPAVLCCIAGLLFLCREKPVYPDTVTENGVSWVKADERYGYALYGREPLTEGNDYRWGNGDEGPSLAVVTDEPLRLAGEPERGEKPLAVYDTLFNFGGVDLTLSETSVRRIVFSEAGRDHTLRLQGRNSITGYEHDIVGYSQQDGIMQRGGTLAITGSEGAELYLDDIYRCGIIADDWEEGHQCRVIVEENVTLIFDRTERPFGGKGEIVINGRAEIGKCLGLSAGNMIINGSITVGETEKMGLGPMTVNGSVTVEETGYLSLSSVTVNGILDIREAEQVGDLARCTIRLGENGRFTVNGQEMKEKEPQEVRGAEP